MREPVAVVVHLRAGEVDDPADLGEVVAGVGLDLLLGQLRSGLVTARRIAHQRGVIADDDDGGVAQVLELTQLAQRNRVPEVHVDARRVDTILHPQRAILADGSLQFLEEFGLGDDLLHAALEDLELLGNIPHGRSLGGFRNTRA